MTTIADEQMVSRLDSLMEVILQVEDMSKQVSFYRDKLGLELTHPKNVEDFTKENWVTFGTGSCIFVLHGGGRIRTGEQPSHRIVFSVKDIRAAREGLMRRGVSLSELRSPAPGVWVVDGRDPEGNVYALESHD